MRDYLIIAIVLSSLPVGLFRPFYGLLVYAWLSYMYPHLLTWSFAQQFPVAKIAALGLLGGVFLHRAGEAAPLKRRENVLMILLFLSFTVSSLFAIYPDRAWDMWQNTLKLVGIGLVTSTMVTDQKKLRAFFLVVAGSLGFYGVKGGIFALFSGGEQMVWGPEPSILFANNSIGLALNMCLPMLWFLAKGEEPKWLKCLLRVAFALTIPAVMFTYSRASALGLGAVLLLILYKSSKKALVLVVGLAVMAGPIVIGFLPERWIYRQQSTLNYESDVSATSRLDEWVYCWKVAVERPLTGGGFGVYSNETYSHYYPEFLVKYGSYWTAHSIYFGILAEHGFIGITIFLAMIGSSLLSLRSIKRSVRGYEDLQSLSRYCDMIQISLVGFLVNGAFVEMEYFDLVYHWVGIVASLKVVAAMELAAKPVQSGDLTTQTLPGNALAAFRLRTDSQALASDLIPPRRPGSQSGSGFYPQVGSGSLPLPLF